jgi:hypothetical protein
LPMGSWKTSNIEHPTTNAQWGNRPATGTA